MALIADVVTRTDDAAGDSFLTFLDGLGRRVQAVVVVNNNGDPAGITGTPLVVSVSNAVAVDDSTPINVNVASEVPAGTTVVYSTGNAPVASAIISTTAGYSLHELRVILDPAATTDRWLMLFDATSVPADTAVPYWRAFLPGGVETSETFQFGLPFPNLGCVAVISSDPEDLAITGAEAYFQAIGIE